MNEGWRRGERLHARRAGAVGVPCHVERGWLSDETRRTLSDETRIPSDETRRTLSDETRIPSDETRIPTSGGSGTIGTIGTGGGGGVGGSGSESGSGSSGGGGISGDGRPSKTCDHSDL